MKWRGLESEVAPEAEVVQEKSEPSTMPPFKRRLPEPIFGLGKKVKGNHGKGYKKAKGEKQIGFPNYK